MANDKILYFGQNFSTITSCVSPKAVQDSALEFGVIQTNLNFIKVKLENITKQFTNEDCKKLNKKYDVQNIHALFHLMDNKPNKFESYPKFMRIEMKLVQSMMDTINKVIESNNKMRNISVPKFKLYSIAALAACYFMNTIASRKYNYTSDS